MITQTLKYAIGYSSLLIIALAMAIENACSSAIDFNTFLIEMTDGLKLITLINSIVVFYVLGNILFQEVLFGGLRSIEYEHLIESMPVFGINLLFNLASNDSNLILNCLILGFAFNFKFFHVIVVDRLDYINLKVINSEEQVTTRFALTQYFINVSFHLNLMFIVVDFIVAKLLVYDIFQGINSITCLLFGFQFAILGVDALTYLFKYLLNVREVLYYKIIDRDGLDLDDDEEIVWENKPYYVKGIDILSCTLKAISHFGFLYLLTFHSGGTLPLAMIQGTYSSLRGTYKEVKKLIDFIEASNKLNDQLQDATREDLDESDSLCIICRDDMFPINEYEAEHGRKMATRRIPKKLDCQHILHMGCLKDWLERSDSCPLCRRKVFLGRATTADAAQTRGQGQERAENVEQDPAQEVHIGDVANNALPEVDGPVAIPGVIVAGTAPNIETFNTPTANLFRSFGSFDSLPFEIPGYQDIYLLNPVVQPPGWRIIPLERLALGDSTYTVKFSANHHGVLEIKSEHENPESDDSEGGEVFQEVQEA